MREKSFWWKLVFYGLTAFVAVFIVVFVLRNSYDIAYPGTTAAKVTFGNVDNTARQGFFWKIPFCSYGVKINTKQQQGLYESSNIKTRDLQTVGLKCSVIYQVNSEKVPEIVMNVEPEKIDSVILFPRIANALQETIGKNDVFLLVTQQEMVREATKYVLADQLAEEGFINIKDVLFYEPGFSPQFEKMIEQKMSEQQLLEIAKIQTQNVEEEAKQLLTLASADLEVLQQKNKLLTNPLIIKYEATKMLQKWNGDIPSTLVLSGEGGSLPVIPIASQVKH